MSARILVVDDLPASVRVLEAKLSSEYYDVLTATDGATALEIVHQQDPDLVLLDVMMPGMDGVEVCRHIKEDQGTTHIPVVMVTALKDADNRVRCLDAGADDFLTKPVNDITLFARVRSLVRLKRMLDQWRMRKETTKMLGFQPPRDSSRLDDGSKARIFLADDSAVERSSISEILSQDHDLVIDIEPTEASSEQVARGDADVVIVGLADEGDGPLRLCSHLRSLDQTRQIPILLVGDEEDMDRLIKALELGINDYIFRPLNKHELLARVRTQVRRKRYQDRLQTDLLHSLSLALTDSLTGLHNRRYLSMHLETVMKRMLESEKPMCLLMIDIDHFKNINDTHGHAAGDTVLSSLAHRIAGNMRGFDLIARYGGEEFVAVMPDTSVDVALQVANRLCEIIAHDPFLIGKEGVRATVTLSIGIADAQGDNDTPEAIIQRADAALYQAKSLGRNRVICSPPGVGEHALTRGKSLSG